MNLIQWFRDSTSATKWFVFNVIIWTLMIVLTTIYSYARLEFVRSGPRTPPQQKETTNNE